MVDRLQKILASAGVASRRGAEIMIQSGDVTVNGRRALLGECADPTIDTILVRGKPLAWRAPVYIGMNKPGGIVTSLRSTHGERTVGDLLIGRSRVFPVGRLDKDTTGLLLLTSDGDWANQVTHPRYNLEKEYVARVEGWPSREAIERLRHGVPLPEGATSAPAVVRTLASGSHQTVLSITVIEGKKRQIRHMLAAVGHPVVSLERVRVGSIVLGDLRPGQIRDLSKEEVESIRELAQNDIAGRGP